MRSSKNTFVKPLKKGPKGPRLHKDKLKRPFSVSLDQSLIKILKKLPQCSRQIEALLKNHFMDQRF